MESNIIVSKQQHVKFKTKKKSVSKHKGNDIKVYQNVLAARDTLHFPEIDASYRKKRKLDYNP